MAGEQLFKFKWIFILPLSSAIFFFVLEFLFAPVVSDPVTSCGAASAGQSR